jgi:hypothetical protein
MNIIPLATQNSNFLDNSIIEHCFLHFFAQPFAGSRLLSLSLAPLSRRSANSAHKGEVERAAHPRINHHRRKRDPWIAVLGLDLPCSTSSIPPPQHSRRDAIVYLASSESLQHPRHPFAPTKSSSNSISTSASSDSQQNPPRPFSPTTAIEHIILPEGDNEQGSTPRQCHPRRATAVARPRSRQRKPTS